MARFRETWETERHKNKKLQFYNKIKESFGAEPYLKLQSNKGTSCVAKIRMSGHRLKIETGRYGTKSDSRLHRICDFCSNTPNMDLLLNLPEVDPIMEDEEHFIRTCPRYHLSRANIKEPTKSLLFHDIQSSFFEEHIEEFARYLSLIFKTRFQKGNRGRS